MSGKSFALIFASFFSCSTALADTLPHSLFFTPQQSRDAELLAEKSSPAGQGDIRLGAIMYYSADDWVLWLRGQRWTPETPQSDLRVLEVTPDHARVQWQQDAGSVPQEFTLRAHESYQIATGKIIASP